ncbi:unnamed protein product [Allacma fusca]|uniref:Uncharacterized protein n=1 Tax=Allacma fusca TaxID=39272 RepID=A0A8J2KJY9_9HEXA|nr:unnamed protein product [Allacma fusca]
MEYTKPRERALLLVEKIEEYERTITLQKHLKAEVERRLGVARQESALIKKQNDEKIRIWPLYRSRLNTMNQERMKRDGELRKRRAYVQERARDLQNLSKARIMQLKQYIFPIQEVYGDSVEGRMLSDKLQSS